MSVDYFFEVPAGARNTTFGYGWKRYGPFDEIPKSLWNLPHHVYMAHGGNCSREDEFYFQDEDDAFWFWNEGFKECLHDGFDCTTRNIMEMSLWINGCRIKHTLDGRD